MNIEIKRVQREHLEDVIQLLQCISVFNPSIESLDEVWRSFTYQTNVHSVVAIIDGIVVGYGSLITETKIRGGKMGHIEDIVSHPSFRGKGIGKAIVDVLYEVARAEGCYKISLQCKERNIEFYKKCLYDPSGIAMQRFVIS